MFKRQRRFGHTGLRQILAWPVFIFICAAHVPFKHKPPAAATSCSTAHKTMKIHQDFTLHAAYLAAHLYERR